MSEGNITECPNCGSRMELKEAPFRYHGSYIGNFEAYVCGVCHHIYFTENAKKEIMEVPTSLEDFEPFIEQEFKVQIVSETNERITKTTTQIDNIQNSLKDKETDTYVKTVTEVE